MHLVTVGEDVRLAVSHLRRSSGGCQDLQTYLAPFSGEGYTGTTLWKIAK